MSKQGATPNEPSKSMALLAKILVGFLVLSFIALFVYLLNPMGGQKNAQPEAETKIKPKNNQPNYEFYELLPEQQVTGVPTQPIASQISASTRPDAIVTGKKSTKSSPATDKTNKTNTNQTDNIDNDVLVDSTQADTTHNKNQEESQAKDTKKQSQKAIITDADANKTYILQINSFDNAEQADQRRAEVLIAGVDAQIVKKRLADNSIIYQVISQQMANQQMASQAQRRLQNSGIDSLIVEQRRN